MVVHGRGLLSTALALVLSLTLAADVRGETKAQQEVPRTEIGIVPLLGGNSDIGLGFGAIASYARLARGVSPFRLRLEALALTSVRSKAGGGVEIPFQDYYLQVDRPGLIDGHLRLVGRASYTRRSTLGYYGIGNDSPDRYIPPGLPRGARLAALRYYQVDLLSPTLRLTALTQIWSALYMSLGVELAYNRVRPYVPSKLVDDLADPRVAPLLFGVGDHVLFEMRSALRWDTRDNEPWTTRGVFHELVGHVGVGRRLQKSLGPPSPSQGSFAFGSVTLALRGYLPLIGRRLMLAGRIIGDVLLGEPPFYTLTMADEQGAIGGEVGVRGVPAQRYYGRAKVFGTAALRSQLFSFRFFRQRMVVGSELFFDAGRVWAELAPRPDLDGPGLGLKVGVGGGLRLRWGETFVLRADAAWSPDARPVAFYFNVGQVF